MLMLNLVQLAPGEAVFLRPRTLHAYLSGIGVEIMAGSDNVLRGGLTPKHIDVDELLGVLEFSHGPLAPTPTTRCPPSSTPGSPRRRSSGSPTDGRCRAGRGGRRPPADPVVHQGSGDGPRDGETIELTGGRSVFVPATSAGSGHRRPVAWFSAPSRALTCTLPHVRVISGSSPVPRCCAMPT